MADDDREHLKGLVGVARRSLQNAIKNQSYTDNPVYKSEGAVESLDAAFEAIADDLAKVKNQTALRAFLIMFMDAGIHSRWPGGAAQLFLGKNIKGGKKGGETAGSILAADKDAKWRNRGLPAAKAFVAANPKAGKRKIAEHIIASVPDAPGEEAVTKTVEQWRKDGKLPPRGG